MSSEPGDYIGGGQDYFFAEGDGTFILNGSFAFSVASVQFHTGNFDNFWSLDFAAPAGTPLSPGNYPDATRWPFNDPGVPGLSVSGNGAGCNMLTGSFRIKEITYSGDAVMSLWATFEQHCEGNESALTGDIRYNADVVVSVSAPVTRRTSYGQTVTFLVTAQEENGNPVALSASDLPDGAAFDDNGDNTGTFTWIPALAQIGSYDVTFTGDNGLGRSDVVTTRIVVTGETALRLHSEPGDPIGQGLDHLYTPDDGPFQITTLPPNGVSVTYGPQYLDGWLVTLTTPVSTPLAVGVYPHSGSDGIPGGPGLTVRRLISCFENRSAYRIRQISIDGLGRVDRLWATFEHRCLGAPGSLYGDVRWNAIVGIDVRAPIVRTVRSGETLTFDVSAGNVAGFPVSLTADTPPGATFEDHGDNTGTLTWTPGLDDIGSHEVTFHGNDGQGGSDVVTTIVEVQGTTSLSVDSEIGDPVGLGNQFFFTPADGIFRAEKTPGNGVRITFTGSFQTWVTEFAAPGDVPLLPGSYPNAVQIFGRGLDEPGMSIAGPYGSCYTLNGGFEVFEIEYGTGNEVIAFRARFEQSCEGGEHSLTGEIRYNSRLPVVVSAPLFLAGTEGEDLEVEITAWSLHPVSLSAVGLPPGADFVDHGDNSGTLTWLPDYDAAGTHIVTFAGSDGQGGADSARTRILIQEGYRRPTADAGGPYVGVVGAPIQFDGSGSFNPEPDSLYAYWDFGDGGYSYDLSPTHSFGAVGVYTVVLQVSNGSVDQDSTTVTIVNEREGRAFQSSGESPIRLSSGKLYTCVRLEAVGNSFQPADVDLSSIRMISTGTGSAGEITASADRTGVSRDTDKSGVPEVEACFAKDDLRRLFSNVTGTQSVTVTIKATLAGGDLVSTNLNVQVIGRTRAATSAGVVEKGRHISFTTNAPGLVTLRLFDISGRAVRTVLERTFFEAGYHLVPLEGDDGFPSGVYFYRLQTEDEVKTGRIVVAR